MPYYTANLNIEQTFKQKTGKYIEYPNISLTDTLANTGFYSEYEQKISESQPLFYGTTDENSERIKRQNKQKFTVILGNPPYRANQKNANDKNPLTLYPKIKSRINETYLKHGKKLDRTTKHKYNDPFYGFYRAMSDRIALTGQGVLAFVSNSSCILCLIISYFFL